MCIQKILNVNLIYFNSLTSLIAKFPTNNFMFVISLQKKIGPHVFVLPIPQFIWQDLAIAWKSSKGEKVCIIYWNLMNEQKQPLKKVFCKKMYSSKHLLYRVSSCLFYQNI